jgi:hypothetical protein
MPMRSRWLLLPLALFLLFLFPHRLPAADARADRKSPRWLLPAPELRADPKIPTLKEVVGHDWAAEISSHAEIERYLRALVAAAPDRARLETYGKTYEGRPLYYLVIASPANLLRLESIRAANLRLADPRRTAADEARRLIAAAPAVVWLAYGIHGNESSSSDAALMTAYHLLADQSEATRQALERLIILIDPAQNPDGRERFISVYRETRGVFPESAPLAAEHTERWPGGRFNHYLFDMNRDWFLQSQVESQARVAAYLRWHPQIYVDAHEMGADNTYYFAPPMDPINELVLPRQQEWLHLLGRHQAARFDQHGFAYTTRELFDGFYPGKGSMWPTMQGAIGILWEQAGVRGLVIDRSDETKLHYHDAVRHHTVSGLATIEAAARHREELLTDFYRSRADAVRLGREGPVKDFFLLEKRSPHRAAHLARLLVQNGIEVRRVRAPIQVRAVCINEGSTGVEEREASGTARSTGVRGEGARKQFAVPAGSYYVPVSQPAGRLLRTLLDRHSDMGQEFIRRQLDRNARRLNDEIYDVTAWSLPLAFGVTCLATAETVPVNSEPLGEATAAGQMAGKTPARVAYLIPGEDSGAMPALAEWLQGGYRVHVADQPFKLGGAAFGKGSLILKVHENPDTVHEAVAEASRKHGVNSHTADTGWADEGAHLGGPHVRWVKPPRVVMIVDRPAAYTVGHTWYLFDQVWRYPVTRVAGRNVGALDLSQYNVLILPEGNYGGADTLNDATVTRLKEWIRQGGTLLLVGGAAAWATGEKVALLASKPERKPAASGSDRPARSAATPSPAPPASPPASPAPPAAPPAAGAPRDEGETPDPVPGAFLRASVYDDHWVTFGYEPETTLMMSGSLILSPLKPTDGRNLVTFTPVERLLVSGFCWPETLKLLPGKPYVLYQPLGDGHVIAFADDPCFRAMYPNQQRLFLNAVMFGPGH